MKQLSDFNFGDDAHIDLTPLIDVIFMLVIFFILTMSFAKPILEVALPSSEVGQSVKKQDFLVVTLHKDGSIVYENRTIDKEDLKLILDTAPEKELNIYADMQTPFQSFVDVVDVAKIKRDGRFSITTKKE